MGRSWQVDSILVEQVIGQNEANPRVAPRAVSDPGLKRFVDGLLPDDWSKGMRFEEAVGTLLHVLGFQVDALSGLSDAVDHLAGRGGSGFRPADQGVGQMSL